MHYQIRVNGVLDGRWAAWFDGLHLAGDERGQTVIAGPVADQAALHGLLAKIRDLGLATRGTPHRARLTPDMEARHAADAHPTTHVSNVTALAWR